MGHISGFNAPYMVCGLLPCVYLLYSDLRYQRLPNIVTAGIFISGNVFALFAGCWSECILGALAAFAITFSVGMAGGVGGGDIKLASGLGVWLGWHDAMIVLIAGSLLAAVWGLNREWRQGTGWRHNGFLSALWHYFVYGVKLPWKMPSLEDVEHRRKAVPLGACLVIAAWMQCIWIIL